MKAQTLEQSWNDEEIYNKNGTWYIFHDGYERALSGHELQSLQLVGGME